MRFRVGCLVASVITGGIIGAYVEPFSLALVLSIVLGLGWGFLGSYLDLS